MLTLNEIRALLDAIELAAELGDHEVAHGLEDRLRARVLEAIAQGQCEAPREAARLALSSREIRFARWVG